MHFFSNSASLPLLYPSASVYIWLCALSKAKWWFPRDPHILLQNSILMWTAKDFTIWLVLITLRQFILSLLWREGQRPQAQEYWKGHGIGIFPKPTGQKSDQINANFSCLKILTYRTFNKHFTSPNLRCCIPETTKKHHGLHLSIGHLWSLLLTVHLLHSVSTSFYTSASNMLPLLPSLVIDWLAVILVMCTYFHKLTETVCQNCLKRTASFIIPGYIINMYPYTHR